MRLHQMTLAWSFAIAWAFTLVVIVWWVIIVEGPNPNELLTVGHVYRGFKVTPMGSVWGLVWGFGDGWITGFLFAWLYNFIGGKKLLPKDKQA